MSNQNAPIQTIRPGVLVSLRTSVEGGVSYNRFDLAVDGLPAAEGQDVARWETIKTVEDKDEHDRAIKARSQAQSLIRKVCHATTFGLLCPKDSEGALNVAIGQARDIVAAFNASAQHTEITLTVLKGRIESDDAEAARVITRDIADLVVKMDQGITALDAEAIRKAADEARRMSSMLSDGAKAKANAAIEQARKAARTIVKRIEKEGEDKAIVLRDLQRGELERARIAFLDMSEAAATEVATIEPLPAVNSQMFADLDLGDAADDDAPESEMQKPAPARQIDLADDSEGSEMRRLGPDDRTTSLMELS